MFTYSELKKLEAAVEAALLRVEAGASTVDDAEVVRRYIEMTRRLIGDRLEAEVAMSRGVFSQFEAKALVGKRVRTRTAFSEVPAGTCGTVVKADEAGSNYGWLLKVRWDLPDRSWPLDGWVTKSEFERFLLLLDGERR